MSKTKKSHLSARCDAELYSALEALAESNQSSISREIIAASWERIIRAAQDGKITVHVRPRAGLKPVR